MQAPNAATAIGKNQGNAAAISAKEESIVGWLDAKRSEDTPKVMRGNAGR
jgi:hypothetical protein